MDKKKDDDEESTRFLKLAILPLDSATPPVNGTEWLSSVKSVFAELGFEHFTLTAFNQIFLGVDKESVMHQYLDMLQKQSTAKGGVLKKEIATVEKDVKNLGGRNQTTIVDVDNVRLSRWIATPVRILINKTLSEHREHELINKPLSDHQRKMLE
jgi:hypothetical protein